MEILIISGLSGAGKSKAASFLEDMGFYIVDNMPAAMILKFAEFCAGGNGRYDRVALVYDVRTASSFTELFDVLDQLKSMDGACRMLFLEASPETIRAQMRQLMDRRKASQPLEWPSAGSTFKRPEGYFAGTLIEQCGLKGLTVGGAQVSKKHAGFLINTGGATCADVMELIRQVQERVWTEKGVRLEPEVRIIR